MDSTNETLYREILEFTPLEFETPRYTLAMAREERIRIYSVGVWNLDPEVEKQYLQIRIYSVGVWNFQTMASFLIWNKIRIYSVGVWN